MLTNQLRPGFVCEKNRQSTNAAPWDQGQNLHTQVYKGRRKGLIGTWLGQPATTKCSQRHQRQNKDKHWKNRNKQGYLGKSRDTLYDNILRPWLDMSLLGRICGLISNYPWCPWLYPLSHSDNNENDNDDKNSKKNKYLKYMRINRI